MGRKRNERRILLVEDDRRVRNLMAVVLRGAGFDVLEVADGMEAMNHLAGARVFADEVPPPDLVVADIAMPNFSGLDLLVGLREHRRRPPVLIVTGVCDPEVHREARRLGARKIVAKPFDVDSFLGAVEDCLGIEQTAASTADSALESGNV